MMNRKRIAIACQGGGSQCAFVAGALKTVLAQQVQDRFQIVGLSGTSGGALTAALAWVGLLKQAHGRPTAIDEPIVAFWKDLSAQTPLEMCIDASCMQLLRLIERGFLPSFASSPSSLQFQFCSELVTRLVSRPEFTDLRALVEKHLDLDAVATLSNSNTPVLLAGAGDVLEGTFKIFSSAHGEIGVDSLLASAAIPNLFPAVWVDGHAYWDGIFASNPPLIPFLAKQFMGNHAMPDEIWIIQVNPFRKVSVPEIPSDIFDRRNQLAGNLSLQHELHLINMVNMLLREGALTDPFRARFGLDTTEAISVRFIRMSEELLLGLDYPSKLSRQPSHIDALMADGEIQAKAFLANLLGEEHSPEQTAPDVSVEGVNGSRRSTQA
jgi:NTE family protein